MNEALDWQAKRITALEKRYTTFAGVINSRIAALQNNVEALEKTNASLQERIEALEKQHQRHDEYHEALDEREETLADLEADRE